jgi:hypothetical protein
MDDRKAPLLVLVGGFLGAGKTTLILKAAEILQKRNLRVATIMNDQDAGLVDTRYAESQRLKAAEVAGGCFCCRFSEFVDAAQALRAYEPDVIFAEPVGSCVDLSATVLQPLKAFYGREFQLAPFTVLLDPQTAAQALHGKAAPDIAYLFGHQVAEADLVCVGKSDLQPVSDELPFPVDFSLSAKSGAGVEAWLDEALAARRIVGAKLLDVDYGRYAEAEAALGWLNVHADVSLRAPKSPALLCGPLLDELHEALTAADITIAHLKLFDRAGSGAIKVSITANGQQPWPQGDLFAEPASEHELAINLRAIADPAELQLLVQKALANIDGTIQVRHLGAFRPPAPKPEHRFRSVHATS